MITLVQIKNIQQPIKVNTLCLSLLLFHGNRDMYLTTCKGVTTTGSILTKWSTDSWFTTELL